MKKFLITVFVISATFFLISCATLEKSTLSELRQPVNSSVPGKLTLPPGTPLALRTIRITLIPHKSTEKAKKFYINFMNPSVQEVIPPSNEMRFVKVKPGKIYYLNFAFTNTPRWLVNKDAVKGTYMYGRILISINGQPPVEFTSGNIELQNGESRNLAVYVP